MKVNLPISQREHLLPEGLTLMSATDPEGRILYANEAFVGVSGFDRQELNGAHHNLVRHPDMPAAAFADMWATLKRGLPWTALVKNRRKNGDHYWVRANAAPVTRDDKTVAYMSVRTTPSRQDVAKAERLYAQWKSGQDGGMRLQHGVLLGRGWRALLTLGRSMPLGQRVAAALLLAIAPAAVALALGASPAVSAIALPSGALLAMAVLHAQVLRPLEEISRQARRVASGQPADCPHLERIDTIGMLMRSINQAGLNLRSLVDDVSTQISGLTAATEQIQAGNQDLFERTESQASNVQQTASSMEQMTSSVQQSADNSNEASRLARQAAEVARQGGEAMSAVVARMSEISQSSDRIADIIGTIDGIAFQTNILALNAAVEAARAGELGRGFAVVAGEVRALAHRSADAAREIKSLIGASASTVEAGNDEVAQAGESIRAVIAQVGRVSELIHDVTQASHEQAQGIGEVNQAVNQLDEMTQRNARLVEDGTGAAHSLHERAEILTAAVSVFRLGQRPPAPGAGHPRPSGRPAS